MMELCKKKDAENMARRYLKTRIIWYFKFFKNYYYFYINYDK